MSRAPLLVLLAAVLLSLSLRGATRAAEPQARALFDGKSLEGWEGNTEMFRVRDGAIVAGTLQARIAHNEFLTTRREYENFELRLEAKLVGEGKNAGVQLRGKRIPDHHEVIGYQCDMGEMQGRNIWGWLYDESRRRKFLAEAADSDAVAKAFKPGEWNRLRIRCEGPRIQIWVNDVQTVDYREPDEKIERRGVIALRFTAAAPAEASYRKLELVELP